MAKAVDTLKNLIPLGVRRIPGRFYVAFLNRYRGTIHQVQRWVQAEWHGRDLELVQDQRSRIASGDVLLFCTLRNEAIRIPYFLSYYRKLGVRHFLFVDNGSTDDFRALVADEPDVTVWYTEASYKASNFGMHWLNYLLRRHGLGHWCVTCDPDEFLVYAHCEDRSLAELGEFLESEGRRSLCCLMLDMYSDRPLMETHYRPGDDPVAAAPFFDGNGYTQARGWLDDTYTRGGVRRRLFFRDDPDRAPALNKTPFVKWQKSDRYFLSMHQLVPPELNAVDGDDALPPTGCVLHFKYLELLKEKAREELERGEHWDGSFEYRRYHERLPELERSFVYDGSLRFSGWQKLAEQGFLSPGRWF